MKVIHLIDVKKEAATLEVRRELLALAGREYYGDFGIGIGIYDTNPNLHRIYDIIAAQGLEPSPVRWGATSYPPCALQIERKYSKKDLLKHDNVEILSGGSWSGHRYEPDGPLELDDSFGRRGWSLSNVSSRIIVVRDRVKRLAEQQALRHVHFRPTILTDWYRDLKDPYSARRLITWESINEEPWWELTSDVRLPRVHPSLELVDNDGSPYIYGVSRGCWKQEGFFKYAELHYRESEIRALEPFDCALTYEPFGGNPREENLIRVISRRFYQLLLTNKVRLAAVPVRLVPD